MAVPAFETEIRKEQFERDQGYKATQRETKDNLRHFDDCTEDVVTSVRKDQHNREQDQKATQRSTKESLKDVNMARAAFA